MIKNNNKSGETYNRSPGRDVHLQEVLPIIPRKRRSEEPRILSDIAMATKRLAIRAEHDPICAFLLDTNAVVREAVGRMEVEDPQQARALKHNDLIALVLQADVRLGRMQPSVLLFRPLHLAVELVQEAVAQQFVVDEIELPARVVEAVAVTFAGEVEPFGMAELVALEVQIAFSAQAVGYQPDHLVQGQTSVDNRGKFRQDGHVGVHLSIAQPEEQRFVADKPEVSLARINVIVERNVRLVVGLCIGDCLLAVPPVR
jgi:hypothetical protein